MPGENELHSETNQPNETGQPNESNLHQYQRFCVDFLEEKPQCALFLDCGLGKTIITLTAISHLLYLVCGLVSVNNIMIQVLIKGVICCTVPVVVYVALNIRNKYMRATPRMLLTILRRR